jgi:hypothetical protein
MIAHALIASTASDGSTIGEPPGGQSALSTCARPVRAARDPAQSCNGSALSRDNVHESVAVMLTLDAESLLVQLADGEDMGLPDIFVHGRDGSLTYGFADTRNTYTWEAAQVREMSERWQALDAPVPPRIADHVWAHHQFLDMLDAGDMEPPDEVVHDLTAGVVRARWDEEKVVLVVEEVAGAAARE